MTDDHLNKTLDEAEWTWLKPHAQRDAVIIISQELNLIDVGKAMRDDDVQRIQLWIQTGQVAKPSNEQVLSWEKMPSKRFKSLVVQPYVLIQEILHH